MEAFPESVLNTGWFTVRCIFEVEPDDRDGAGQQHLYEERITLWRAAGFDEAIELGESDAREYAGSVGAAYLGLAQCSKADRPVQGAEVYSLMRESDLEPDVYVSGFFDTGTERQQRTT